MPDRSLAWRVEQACFNAWPALREVLVEDWIARLAPGVSRRANSANPLSAAACADDELISKCEAVYAGWAAPAIFRVPTLVDQAIDRRLEQRGYAREAETSTLYGDFDGVSHERHADVKLAQRPSSAWLAAKAQMNGFETNQARTYRQVIARLALPGAFAAIRHEGAFASLAFGAIHDGLFCLESVVTAQSLRGRGFSRRTLSALLGWAEARGARGACLQVQSDNAPAVALYRSLGLTTELYRYHYRRTPSRADV